MTKLKISFCINARLKFLIFGWVFILTGCSGLTKPEPTPTSKPKEVEVYKDLAYHQDELEEHELDIYQPVGKEGPFPTLLMIHGGGGKKEDLAYWGNLFAKKGILAVSIDHRQWPDYSYPDHIEDAFCALAWLNTNRESYQIDPENIFVMGHSAGGSLAALLGVIDDPELFQGNCPSPLSKIENLQGVIAFTGIFDYSTAVENSPSLNKYAEELFGGTLDNIPEIWSQASAASWIDANDPAFLLIHGLDDTSIPPTQSQIFASQLETEGLEVDLILVSGAGHNQIKGSSESIDAVDRFIQGLIK